LKWLLAVRSDSERCFIRKHAFEAESCTKENAQGFAAKLQVNAPSPSRPNLRNAVEVIPDALTSAWGVKPGAWQDSAPYFEFVAQKRPKFPDAQYSLAAVYARIQRVPEAVELLRKVIEQNPEHFRAPIFSWDESSLCSIMPKMPFPT
jgi:tetratricopeptide (TPR) repeat protein